MNYYFDTEFMEDGKTIELLSIGIVAEDGRELYLENSEADHSKANAFVKAEVLPYLERSEEVLRTKKQIAKAVRKFCLDDLNNLQRQAQHQFWAYYCAYDWVVMCQLFGNMTDLPEGFPMWCHDLMQTGVEVRKVTHEKNCWIAGGDVKFRIPGFNKHHALHDARWCKLAYHAIEQVRDKRGF